MYPNHRSQTHLQQAVQEGILILFIIPPPHSAALSVSDKTRREKQAQETAFVKATSMRRLTLHT